MEISIELILLFLLVNLVVSIPFNIYQTYRTRKRMIELYKKGHMDALKGITNAFEKEFSKRGVGR